MLYDDVLFRGEQVYKERQRVSRDRMTAATFTAWLTLPAQAKKVPKWEEYLKMCGLSDEPKVTKADLKREAEQALANKDRIVAMHKGGKQCR